MSNLPISSRTVRLSPSEMFGATDFISLAASLMVTKGSADAAAAYAEAHGTSERVQRVLRSAVGAGGLTDSGWAGSLGGSTLVGGFLESLQSISVFDALVAGGMLKIPLRTRAVSVTVAAAGHIGSEGAPMRVSSLAFDDGNQLEPRRAYALIVMSEELASQALSFASGFFANELRKGVAQATDAQFISDLIAGTSPIVSSGTDFAAFEADLAALLAAVSPKANSRLFVIMRTGNALALSLARGADGELLFPGMSYRGGELQRDMPALVSDQCPEGAVVLADASGLAGNSGEVTLDGSAVTSLQLDSEPTNNSITPTATTMVSLFQSNSRALRAERWFGAEVVRASAVASMSEVDWFSAGGSDS